MRGSVLEISRVLAQLIFTINLGPILRLFHLVSLLYISFPIWIMEKQNDLPKVTQWVSSEVGLQIWQSNFRAWSRKEAVLFAYCHPVQTCHTCVRAEFNRKSKYSLSHKHLSHIVRLCLSLDLSNFGRFQQWWVWLFLLAFWLSKADYPWPNTKSPTRSLWTFPND